MFVVHTVAQVANYSQYFNTPLTVNPANTGNNSNHPYRIGVNYRNQWAVLASTPYQTMNVWGEVQIVGKQETTGWWGIGGSILQEVAGAVAFTSTAMYGTVAYHKIISDKILLSGGFAIGEVLQSINLTKLRFDDQWNGSVFDGSIPSNEPLARNRIAYFDLKAGLKAIFFTSSRSQISIGTSVGNITSPSVSFYKNEPYSNAKLSPNINIVADAYFKTEDFSWALAPSFYFQQSTNSNEIVLGLLVNKNLTGDEEMTKQLILGTYYRVGDAIIPMLGVQSGQWRLLFNYDATASNVTKFNNTQGAYEVSLIFTGRRKQHFVKCPNNIF